MHDNRLAAKVATCRVTVLPLRREQAIAQVVEEGLAIGLGQEVGPIALAVAICLGLVAATAMHLEEVLVDTTARMLAPAATAALRA